MASELLMRDIRRFPITQAESVQCLLTLASQIRLEGRRGDMRPMLLRRAAKIVQAAESETAASKVAIEQGSGVTPSEEEDDGKGVLRE